MSKFKLTVNGQLFVAAALTVATLAGKDIPYYMDGVLVVPTRHGVYLVGSTGAAITVAEDTSAQVEGGSLPPEGVLIKVPKVFFAAMKTSPHVEFDLPADLGKGGDGVVRANGKKAVFEVIDAAYPNWRSVIARAGEDTMPHTRRSTADGTPPLSLALSMHSLEPILAIAKLVKRHGFETQIVSFGADTPLPGPTILVRYKGRDDLLTLLVQATRRDEDGDDTWINRVPFSTVA